MAKIVLVNVVGLTSRLLKHAPNISRNLQSGWHSSLCECQPAVTCSAQATLLTGSLPNEHGVVANGWLFRNTQEVRFWQQSSRLIQSSTFYTIALERARVRQRSMKCAKLFWWFNQGANVGISLTPKPWYALNGDKSFDIYGTPDGLPRRIKNRLGPFPFPHFWGPMSGLKSTDWIAEACVDVLTHEQPDLTLVYLPHLDYEPQRKGPSHCDMKTLVAEVDTCCEKIIRAAESIDAKVWFVSEYGHCDVTTPVYPNRLLRQAGLLRTQLGPFGELIDLYASPAFAVCDHQHAHLYVRSSEEISKIVKVFETCPDVGQIYVGEERRQIGLDHPNSGEIVLAAKPYSWFAYPYWMDDRVAPDFARSVAIHHKPGFDPCELFFDPKLMFPKLRVARRLLQKKLGFRTTFDVIPLDASIVRGSHGLPAADELDRPILIGHGPKPAGQLDMTSVKDLILNALGLPENE